MTLTENQVDQISTALENFGVSSDSLREDLLDHVCTHIENSQQRDFNRALQEAIASFGGQDAFGRIQRQTVFVLQHRSNMKRKKLVIKSAYITAFLFTVALMFKIMHWPFANRLLMVSGVALLILVVTMIHRYVRLQQQKKLTH